jgi:hypothetical protein
MEESKIKKSVSQLCLTALISFIIGIFFGPYALIGWELTFPTKRPYPYPYAQGGAAFFFYSTMNALFEGTYNPEENSVSPEALKTFREYASRLGGKCKVYISEVSSSLYRGKAFFPSGDLFDVEIVQTGDRWVLNYFCHRKWDIIWREALSDIERDSEQSSK